MGVLLDVLLGRQPTPLPTPEPLSPPRVHTFELGQGIAADKATWDALVGVASLGSVSRAECERTPAVIRGINLICVLATLPLRQRNPAGEASKNVLLEQPESLSGRTRSCTWSAVVRDLVIDSESLLLVVQRGADGFPVAVHHVPHDAWSRDPATGAVTAGGRERDPAECIVFEVDQPPLTRTGAVAVRNLARIEAASTAYVESPEPTITFESDQEFPLEERQAFVAEWRAARKRGVEAFLPAGVRITQATRMTAEELSLDGTRTAAVLQISRLLGVDASDLSVGVAGSNLTYANQESRRRALVDLTWAPYRAAIEERLSLDSVTPHGHRVLFVMDAFLRSTTAERFAAHKVALEAGFETLDEVRKLEDLPMLPPEANTLA